MHSLASGTQWLSCKPQGGRVPRLDGRHTAAGGAGTIMAQMEIPGIAKAFRVEVCIGLPPRAVCRAQGRRSPVQTAARAFVAPRSANVDPESPDTGETEGDSPSIDNRPDPCGDSMGARPVAH